MTISKAILFATATVLFISSCRKKDDVGATDIYTNFETTAQGITAAEDSITIKVKLSSAAAADIPVVLAVTETGVATGVDYNTTPAINAGKINLVVPSGNNETSFKVKKVAGKLFDGDEKIVFDIFSSGAPVIIGATKQLTLTFAELVATSTGTVIVPGGGPTYPNKVFIDISASRLTGVNRTSCDLGFYGGADFKVILNSSVNMMVKAIAKNDLNAVTVADTVGLTHDLGFSQASPAPSQLPYFDYPDGDLAKTAIKEVAATATDNKVYIVNRGNGIGTGAASRGWKKIRVIRNTSGGYTLQHAAIEATSFTSVDIAKDANYNFKYASFETGALNVEPEKKKWDLAWTYFANVFNFGGEVPYLFQDMVIQNRGVGVAKISTAAPSTSKEFSAFTAADITGLTFSTAQNTIGADWRRTSPSPAIVYTDRYYIIKDADANYYKLKFTSLTTNNERGAPTYEAVWLKKD